MKATPSIERMFLYSERSQNLKIDCSNYYVSYKRKGVEGKLFFTLEAKKIFSYRNFPLNAEKYRSCTGEKCTSMTSEQVIVPSRKNICKKSSSEKPFAFLLQYYRVNQSAVICVKEKNVKYLILSKKTVKIYDRFESILIEAVVKNKKKQHINLRSVST